jgi:hypothetical protein
MPETAVVNIMAALKESMDAKGRAKCPRRGAEAYGQAAWTANCAVTAERTPHGTLGVGE